MAELLSTGAEFSEPDRVYRFRLWRRWAEGPMLLVIGLNPSTADESQDDPTIRRCLGFAHRWGFAGLMMMNIFAFRATDPTVMRKAVDPIGPNNVAQIVDEARATVKGKGAILAAWGNHGQHLQHGREVKWSLSWSYFHNSDTPRLGVACLGLTQSGEPKHPLYLHAATKPTPFLGDGGILCAGVDRG